MDKKSYNRYFIPCIAALGGLLFGFDIGIISGTIPFIQPYFGWSNLELGWGVSSILLGAIAGAIVSGIFTEKYGRKRLLVFIALTFAVSSIITAVTSQSHIFIMARFLGGLAVGSTSVLVPMYIAEITAPGKRGMFVSIYQLAIVAGILTSYIVNFLLHDLDNNWRWMFATGVVPSVMFFTGLFFIPESPRWLYKAGRKEEALAVLGRVRDSKNIQGEILEIAESLKEDTKSVNFRELFRPDVRSAIFVGFFLAILVQVSGINTIIEYAPKILIASGVDISSALLQTSLIGLINFVFTFIAILLIDKVGRRVLYIAGSLGMTVSLVMLSFSFFLGFSSLFTLICIMLFIAFFASCIGPVFWTLVSEIFPNRIRGISVAFISFTQWIFNFVVVLLFPHFLSLIGGAGTFLFLAVMSFLQLLFTWLYVPETKGKSLEEIEKYWKTKQII